MPLFWLILARTMRSTRGLQVTTMTDIAMRAENLSKRRHIGKTIRQDTPFYDLCLT